jgi:hypothetical protein
MTTGEDGGTDKLPWSRRRHRREGFKQYGREVLEALEFQEFQPDESIVGGDTVVVLGHERCLVRATGRVVNANWAQIFTIRGRSDLPVPRIEASRLMMPVENQGLDVFAAPRIARRFPSHS